MKLLFLAPRLGRPQLLGYQVRAYHQLRLLSRRHQVTLVCFAEPGPSISTLSEIAPWCHEIVVVPAQPALAPWRVLRGLVEGGPLQVALYQTAGMRRAFEQVLLRSRPDLIHVQLLRMAPVADGAAGIPRVLDLVDALSANMQRRARLDSWPLRWAAALEARRLRVEEVQACQTWDRLTVVSEADRHSIGPFERLLVNPSGVDVERFRPSGQPRAPGQIVFSGNLGYFPNVDGLCWFAREVLPLLHRRSPAARLLVLGARPNRRVRQLARTTPGIDLLGFVPDLQPHLASSSVAIAPIRAGSGQLFKVLEAMACGVPVVATSLAASGLDVEPGRHLLVADTAAEFAVQVLRLLDDPAFALEVGHEGRRLVEDRYRWERSVEQLDSIYGTLAP